MPGLSTRARAHFEFSRLFIVKNASWKARNTLRVWRVMRCSSVGATNSREASLRRNIFTTVDDKKNSTDANPEAMAFDSAQWRRQPSPTERRVYRQNGRINVFVFSEDSSTFTSLREWHWFFVFESFDGRRHVMCSCFSVIQYKTIVADDYVYRTTCASRLNNTRTEKIIWTCSIHVLDSMASRRDFIRTLTGG